MFITKNEFKSMIKEINDLEKNTHDLKRINRELQFRRGKQEGTHSETFKLLQENTILHQRNYKLKQRNKDLEKRLSGSNEGRLSFEQSVMEQDNKRLLKENTKLKEQIRNNSLLYANNDILKEFKTEIHFSSITNLPIYISIGDEKYIVHDIEKIS